MSAEHHAVMDDAQKWLEMEVTKIGPCCRSHAASGFIVSPSNMAPALRSLYLTGWSYNFFILLRLESEGKFQL